MRSLPFYTVLLLSALVLVWNYSIEDADLGGADYVMAASEGETATDSAAFRSLPFGFAAQEDGATSELVAFDERTTRERLAGAAGDELTSMSGGDVRGREPVHHAGGRLVPDTWVYDVDNYPGGAKRAEGYRAGGLRVGYWIEWYEDGSFEAEGQYLADECEGEWVRHHRSGGVHLRETYRGGELFGRLQRWNENGAQIEASAYERGEPHGQWTEWYSNGQLRSRGRFVQGQHTGYWEFFDSDGRADVRTGHYVEGRRTDQDPDQDPDGEGQP